MQCTYRRNIEAPACKDCRRGKAIIITYSECVSVASSIQHAKRIRRIVLSSVASLAVQNLSILSHRRNDFGKKSYWNKIYVVIFSKLLSKTFLPIRRIQRDFVISGFGSSCKVPVFLVNVQ
jgi:hypothetical protein